MIHRLIGKRARLKRLSDGAELNGWVTRYSDMRLYVETELNLPIEPGDTFECFVSAERTEAQFTAMARGPLKEADKYEAEFGSNALAQQPKLEATLDLMSEIRFGLSDEPVRLRNEEVSVSIEDEGQELECKLVDIAPEGVGLLLPKSFEIGTKLQLCIFTVARTIDTLATVRYCKPEGDSGELFRVGLQFERLDRLAAASWSKLFR